MLGYARPKGLESPPREKEIIELPEIAELVEYDETFEESNLARWNRYRQMYMNANPVPVPIAQVKKPDSKKDKQKVTPLRNESPRKFKQRSLKTRVKKTIKNTIRKSWKAIKKWKDPSDSDEIEEEGSNTSDDESVISRKLGLSSFSKQNKSAKSN